MNNDPLSAIINAAVKDAIQAALRQQGSAENRKLLTMEQAGERIGRSAAAIRHLVNSETIPASVVKRIGRRVFVKLEDFDRWIDAQ